MSYAIFESRQGKQETDSRHCSLELFERGDFLLLWLLDFDSLSFGSTAWGSRFLSRVKPSQQKHVVRQREKRELTDRPDPELRGVRLLARARGFSSLS